MDTQYGAPVITARQCVCVGFGVFLGSHIKGVVATESESEACNRRKLSGASEVPVKLLGASRRLMIRVEVKHDALMKEHQTQ